MKVLIMKTLIPYVRNNLDMLADTLCKLIIDSGHDSEVLRIPFNIKDPDKQASQVLLARVFEVWNTDLLISLDYPTCLIRNQNHIVWINDDLPWNIKGSDEERLMLSQLAINLPEAKRVFVSSEKLRNRLCNDVGINPELMQFPSTPDQWHEVIKSLFALLGEVNDQR